MHYQHRNLSLSRYQSAHSAHSSSHNGVFIEVLQKEKQWADHHAAVLTVLFVMGLCAFGSLIYYKATSNLAYIPKSDSNLSATEVVNIPQSEQFASQYTTNK